MMGKAAEIKITITNILRVTEVLNWICWVKIHLNSFSNHLDWVMVVIACLTSMTLMKPKTQVH